MAIPLTKDGRREILILTLILLHAAGFALYLGRYSWIGIAAAIPLLLAWIWVIAFFRDPNRTPPTQPGLFLSSADGTVTDITPIGPDSELGRPGLRIGIFMSVFSVHVNRMPCDAQVVSVHHKPGKFLDARDPLATQANESVTVTLNYSADGQTYPVVVRQIAGLVARRIICRAKPGDTVARGQRFGLIKFGSRGELLLPTELAGDIRVRVGQKTKAGLTILAAHPAGDRP